jgi:nitric oxide dioxygenase
VRRNYSLSAAPNGRSYRISVKREPGGLVSNYLHDRVQEGDTLDLFPPAGEFTLTEGRGPLVFITGGVGITPALAMSEAALEGGRPITFIHYARNAGVHAFGDTIDAWALRHSQLKAYTVYEQADGAARMPDAIGRPALAQLRAWLPDGGEFEAYFLGPKPFMAFIKRALRELGLPDERSRHEFFGPAEALN